MFDEAWSSDLSRARKVSGEVEALLGEV